MSFSIGKKAVYSRVFRGLWRGLLVQRAPARPAAHGSRGWGARRRAAGGGQRHRHMPLTCGRVTVGMAARTDRVDKRRRPVFTCTPPPPPPSVFRLPDDVQSDSFDRESVVYTPVCTHGQLYVCTYIL